jgi:hypothetical protein
MLNSEFPILIRRSRRVTSGLLGQESSIENSALVRSLLILHQECSIRHRTPDGCMDGSQGLSECNERNPWITVSETKTAPQRRGAESSALSGCGILDHLHNRGTQKTRTPG